MKTPFHPVTPRNVTPVSFEPAADVVFITGGLKAALHSQNHIRDNVLGDVSEALNCTPEDLNFLFEDGENREDDTIFDFPDEDRRRKVMRDNFLDAAE